MDYITGVNPAAEQLARQSSGALAGISCLDVFTSSTGLSVLAKLCRKAQHGQTITNHPTLLYPDDPAKRCTLQVSIIALAEADKSAGNRVVIILQNKDRRTPVHQLALDSVTDGVLTVDESWTITSFNTSG